MPDRLAIEINTRSATPYYYQVKEGITNLLIRGDLKPGDMLPTEFSLADQLGISRLTIHRALRELVAEGMLVRRRGRGTFVALPETPAVLVEGPLLGLTESISRLGLQGTSRVLEQRVLFSPPAVASVLELTPGEQAIFIRTLRSVNQLPVCIENMYFPLKRFPDLAVLDLNNRSIYDLLEERYNSHPIEAVDRIQATAATLDDAALLCIRPGSPVIRIYRSSTDAAGKTIEVSTVIYHSERFQFVVRVKRLR